MGHIAKECLRVSLVQLSLIAELAKTVDSQVAVVIAAMGNTLVKCGLAVALAGMPLAKPIC